MKAKNIAYLILAAVMLTACESREDVFSHRNQTPEVLLSLSPDFPDTTAMLDVYMRFGEQQKVFFRLNDDNLLNLENPFSASYTAQIVDAVAVDGDRAATLKKDLEVAVVENMIVLTSTTPERTRLSSAVKYTVVLTCRDAYEVEAQGLSARTAHRRYRFHTSALMSTTSIWARTTPRGTDSRFRLWPVWILTAMKSLLMSTSLAVTTRLN